MNEKGSVKVPNMHFSWLKVLEPEFKKSYMNELRDFLKQEKSKKKKLSFHQLIKHLLA